MIMDGAMGTMIQQYALSEEEYCGERFRAHSKLLQGNNDLLSITKPDVIQAIHRAYLEAGADFIETNTFNANSISQSDYDLSDLSYELNYASAKIAKAVATEISQKTPEIPRYVVGALCPTNRTASISPDVNNSGARNITFPQLVDDYAAHGFLNIVGGCCGTTPQHIQLLKETVSKYAPRKIPETSHNTRFSGLEMLEVREDTNFINVGERTNIAGSTKFAKLIREENYDAALDIALHQV